MSKKSVALALVAFALGCVAAFYFHQDSEYRRVHGHVVEVGLDNWKQEVDDNQSSVPVLLYFSRNGVHVDQRADLDKFAWANAGKVKVVAVDCDHIENLIFALKYGVTRFPGYVILYRDQVTSGPDGTAASDAELTRLIEKALGK